MLLTVVEGFKDPHRFVQVARRAREAGKPLAVLKLGASEAGAAMVETHSGALAGSAEVHRAVFDELNVIAAEDLDQLWELAALLTAWGPPTGAVDRLGLITLSVGDGAIIADEVSRLGMTLPPPSPDVIADCAAAFPGVYVANPFDSQAATAVTGAGSWPEQIGAVAADPAYDAVLLSLPVLATPDTVPVIPPHHGVLSAFVGGHRDPEFGPFVLVGLGGGLAEPYADIGRATCPATPDRVAAVLAGTTFGELLARDARAHTALRDLVVRLSEAFAADESLVSFDLNPILIRADSSLVAVDARIEHTPEAT